MLSQKRRKLEGFQGGPNEDKSMSTGEKSIASCVKPDRSTLAAMAIPKVIENDTTTTSRSVLGSWQRRGRDRLSRRLYADNSSITNATTGKYTKSPEILRPKSSQNGSSS